MIYHSFLSTTKRQHNLKRSPCCVSVPDFWHHESVLNHERVTDGGHHGEDLLTGRVSPHQVEQGVGLVLGVQFVDTLLGDQLHRDPTVILEEEIKKKTGWKSFKFKG